MRTLAIGDIHGCFNALTTLAEFVPFRREDRLVTLGDYVDRKARGKLITLRGNHEVMMLAAPKSDRHFEEWLSCGGDAALKSYSTFLRRGRIEDIPESHRKFVKATRKFFLSDGE